MSGDRNQDDDEQIRNARSAVDKPVSELDFVSQYENEIGSSSRYRDGGEGDEESEGGAIDRALKLLGLDGRRTSSQGSARWQEDLLDQWSEKGWCGARLGRAEQCEAQQRRAQHRGAEMRRGRAEESRAALSLQRRKLQKAPGSEAKWGNVM
jgi:hypothetical protein